MKFDLRINPGWTVIDVRTGLPVNRVRWVDDTTHEVAWCACAREIDKGEGARAVFASAFGVSAGELYQHCSDDEYVKPMPKVKIDNVRKTILVNVNDAIKPEEAETTPYQHQQQAGQKRGFLILTMLD
jgi:hypothetical protein